MAESGFQDPVESGQATVSRRAVLGATVGGIGGAAVVGLAAAASWPDSGGEEATTEATGETGPAADSGLQLDAEAVPPDDFVARDARLAPATEERERRITVTAREDIGEVAPGVSQQLWSFDGTVPGPTYRGHLDDRFVFTLVNEGEVGHSIDFHASKVAWNDEMRTIASGESLDYVFEAQHAGIFMYHCGTAPALHHIGAGMYGALIVDPPDLAPVDHEFVFVQSELYFGPEDGPGDLDKMLAEEWDAVVFNGYAFQYQHQPIRVEPNERIRAWVLDVGPSENCSFHIVGTIFDTAYKEGAYRLRPDATRGGCQALDLQPAQGGFVEFTFDEPGLYPIVTHKFANPGQGALGLFQAGEVEAAATAGGH